MFYHVEKDKINYYVGKGPECNKCTIDIKKIMSCTFNTIVKENNIEYYCMGCTEAAKAAFSRYSSFKNGSWYGTFIIVPSVPFGAVIYNPSATRPGKNTNMDTTTAARVQLGDEVVIDNTVHADRISFEGAQVGLLESEVDEKKEILGDDELDNFFTEHKEAVLLPEEIIPKKIKEIEAQE